MGDVGQIGAAGISSAASIANNLATNKANKEIAEQNNETSIRIANENNQLQQQLNSENNQFAHDEAQLSFDRAVEQWMRENEYNTPVEQLKRFQQAGINPTLGLLGNSAMPAANSPAALMASPHGSGITPSMPQLQQAVMNPFDIGDNIMKAVTALANAKKTGLESKSLQETMDSIIAKAKEDARFAENQSDMAEMQNYLTQRYGEKRFNAETNKLLEDAYLSTSLAFKALREGETQLAVKQRELAHRDLLKLDSELKIKERDNWEELYDLKKNNIIADTRSKNASAEESHAYALTEDTLREVRKSLVGSEAELKEIDSKVESALFRSGQRFSERINQIQKVAADRGIAELDYKQAQDLYPIAVKMAEQDREKGDMRDWLYYVDKLCSALSQAGGSFAGAYLGTRMGRPSARPVTGFR